MYTASPRARKALLGSLAIVSATAFALVGCSGGGGGESAPSSFEFLKNSENTTTQPVLDALASGACEAQNETLPLEFSSMPQAELDAQIQLLASQGGLPPDHVAPS